MAQTRYPYIDKQFRTKAGRAKFIRQVTRNIEKEAIRLAERDLYTTDSPDGAYLKVKVLQASEGFRPPVWRR